MLTQNYFCETKPWHRKSGGAIRVHEIGPISGITIQALQNFSSCVLGVIVDARRDQPFG